jgi:hypothetical protein
LFWTIPISASSVNLQQNKGTARLRVADLGVSDFGDFLNAVSSLPPEPPPNSRPSHVSFEVLWHGGGETSSIRDTDYGFTGDFVTGDATISFRARNDGSDVEFRSDPDDQSTAGPPGVGRERNGVFFT